MANEYQEFFDSVREDRKRQKFSCNVNAIELCTVGSTVQTNNVKRIWRASAEFSNCVDAKKTLCSYGATADDALNNLFVKVDLHTPNFSFFDEHKGD